MKTTERFQQTIAKRNKARAKRAEKALFYFYKECGYTREETKIEGFNTALTDLIADVFHFCDLRELDFEAVQKMAYEHYCAEKHEL